MWIPPVESHSGGYQSVNLSTCGVSVLECGSIPAGLWPQVNFTWTRNGTDLDIDRQQVGRTVLLVSAALVRCMVYSLSFTVCMCVCVCLRMCVFVYVCACVRVRVCV